MSKQYEIYRRPQDRLRELVLPALRRAAGLPIHHYYEPFLAVDSVSLEVARGETVGIVGENGSGKSTLLQMICGTLTPTAGSVSLNGRIHSLLELGAGFDPEFTGRENVFANGAVLGIPVSELAERFDEIVRFADIGPFIDQPVKTYSSGMYVRLAFSVQACLDPDLLVVDEALAVGDEHFVHKCFDRIRDLKKGGTSILFVSHDTGSVRALCDRAVWLHRGKVMMDGCPDEVVTRYRSHLFGIPAAASGKPANVASTEIAVTDASRSADASVGDMPDERFSDSSIRIGRHHCIVMGVSLLDDVTLRCRDEFVGGEVLRIRVALQNRSLATPCNVVVGFAIRLPNGEEVCAVNSNMVGAAIACPLPGERAMVDVAVELPPLHPGRYSVTVALASGPAEELVVEDRVDNARLFSLLPTEPVYGLMRVPATFTRIDGVPGTPANA